MAQIVFNIPDAQLPRVVNALSDYYGWTPSLGIPRGQFVKQQIAALFVQTVKNAEVNQALADARATTEGNFVDPGIS